MPSTTLAGFVPDRIGQASGTPAPTEVAEATPLVLRDPFDFKERRKDVFKGVKDSFEKSFKVENDRHELNVHDLEYEPKTYTKKDEKEALESGRTLDVPLKGTIRMLDKQTGDIVAEKRTTLARVPYMTDRGTFVHQGSSYSVGSQVRLKPGTYVRTTAAGDVEMHANVLPGTGRGFRLAMEPKTGLFSLEAGNAKLPALPILKALGCDEKDIRGVIGDELYDKNEKKGARFDIKKAVDKLATDRDVKAGGSDSEILRRAFGRMKIDPEVTNRSVGIAHDTITPKVMLGGMGKIIKVHKGEAEADDRDSLANVSFHTAESHFGERVAKDAGGLRRKLLWGATNKGNLDHIGPGAFTPYMKSVLVGSGLAAPMAEVNPLEVADGVLKVTRLGEGGMSGDAVSVDTRSVHPSQFGFVDPTKTPESNSAGIDMRLSNGVKFGSDGNIYQAFRNLKTGKDEHMTPVQALQQKILFPHESEKLSGTRYGMSGGRETAMGANDATHELQHAHNMFSLASSIIPGAAGAKGGRLSMGARFWTQALALENGEAPLVRTAHHEGGTMEQRVGGMLGAVSAPADGHVVKVDDHEIHVKGVDGKVHTIERYNNLTANQKSVLHTTPVVKVGDQVRSGQTLAKSNYTDNQGMLAMGRNMRVAYLPVSGTFEDGLVVSKSAAEKLTSHHMYQPSIDTRSSDVVVDKKKFMSIWPSKFTKAQLDKIGDDGRAKPGALLHPGDPAILAISKREPRAGQSLIKGGQGWFSDASATWDKDHPGEVTASREHKGYHQVSIKTTAGAELADKIASLYGMKGVISKIVPDDQMIHDKDGKPFDMMLNSNGIISRVNPSILATAALGKVAAHTGKPLDLPAFPKGDIAKYALQKLKEHGLEETETVIDPQAGRNIHNVFTGNIYALKLHHTAVAKGDVRSTGAYSMDDTPAKSGEGGAKRIGGLDVSAILAHGATGVLEDAKLVRGQKNDQFWRDFKLGLPVRMPEKSVTYDKFENMLRGAGVNVSRSDSGVRVHAMTDKDVDGLAKGRKLESGDALDLKGMSPIKGGLFDVGLTGGHGGSSWAAMHLHEPMPSPIVEEPIRRILGMTKAKFEDQLRQPDGGNALKDKLSKVDVKAKISELKGVVRDGSPSERNDAVKTLNYLQAFDQQGVNLSDLVVSKVPVLPPKFRPVTFQRGVELTSDANLLYKDLFEANSQLERMKSKVGDVGEERVAVYHAMKALSGLGDPVSKERQDKGVAGLLAHVFGKNTSKYGLWQRSVVSTPVDMVGRAVITPDDRLHLDQVGIPEDKAWELYKPFIMRRLSQKYQTGQQNGISAPELAKWIEKKDPRAKQEMLTEMGQRPVLVNRAPVWHKFGFLAAHPVLTVGRQVRIPPLLCAGFGADFDGDTMQFHVPITDRAVKDALEKMLPSKNLYAENSFGPQIKPSQEYLLGLHMATAAAENVKPVVFKTMEDAKRAYNRGDIKINTPIEIKP